MSFDNLPAPTGDVSASIAQRLSNPKSFVFKFLLLDKNFNFFEAVPLIQIRFIQDNFILNDSAFQKYFVKNISTFESCIV